MLITIRESIGGALYWAIVTVASLVLAARDLWLYQEFRGGHIWRPTPDGQYEFCMMCGSMTDKVTCRDFALHYE